MRFLPTLSTVRRSEDPQSAWRMVRGPITLREWDDQSAVRELRSPGDAGVGTLLLEYDAVTFPAHVLPPICGRHTSPLTWPSIRSSVGFSLSGS